MYQLANSGLNHIPMPVGTEPWVIVMLCWIPRFVKVGRVDRRMEGAMSWERRGDGRA